MKPNIILNTALGMALGMFILKVAEANTPLSTLTK